MPEPMYRRIADDLRQKIGSGEQACASEAAMLRRRPVDSVPRVEIQQASGPVASELGLEDGSADRNQFVINVGAVPEVTAGSGEPAPVRDLA